MISGSLFSLKTMSILIAILFLLIISTISVLIIYIIKFKKYEIKYNNIWSEFYKGNLEKDIESIIANINKTQDACKETQILCSEIDGKMTKCIQKIGLVKYDAYEGAKSGISFAIAFLDNKNDGIIINSVYNRNFSNIYAKEVSSGTVNGNISEEENEALKKALNSKSFM